MDYHDAALVALFLVAAYLAYAATYALCLLARYLYIPEDGDDP